MQRFISLIIDEMQRFLAAKTDEMQIFIEPKSDEMQRFEAQAIKRSTPQRAFHPFAKRGFSLRWALGICKMIRMLGLHLVQQGFCKCYSENAYHFLEGL